MARKKNPVREAMRTNLARPEQSEKAVLAERLGRLPYDLLLAFAEFGELWMTLPPLVRSAVAGHEVLVHDRHVKEGSAAYNVYAERGLLRRAMVRRGSVEGHMALCAFMVRLIRQSDGEAERRGVDADLEAVWSDPPGARKG